MSSIVTYVGIDHSLSACGIAEVTIHTRDRKVIGHRAATFGTDSKTEMSERLHYLGVNVARFIDWGKMPVLSIEGFAFGAKYQRESMGMVVGALRFAIADKRPLDPGLEVIQPREVKVALVPDYFGWSLDNWVASGRRRDKAPMRTNKKGVVSFKTTMPEKSDVIAGLYRLYGINCLADAEADATGVALANAIRKGHGPRATAQSGTDANRQEKVVVPSPSVQREDRRRENARRPEPEGSGRDVPASRQGNPGDGSGLFSRRQ
jgi:Holliday junction resolvasome RuvABC endonuclease subunit